jgi:hypothetical protein
MSTKIINIVDTDLNNTELEMVSVVRRHINYVLSGSIKYQKIGINWLFNDLTEGFSKITFQECCTVLALPIELIRIRMQFELYSHSIRWEKLNCPLPVVIKEEIEYFCSDFTLDLAIKIWQTPGINREQIDSSTIQILSENNFLMINEFRQCWLTCRNPIVNKNINWSKCWSFYG